MVTKDQIDKKSWTSLQGQLGREDGGTQRLGKDGKPVVGKNRKSGMLQGPKAPAVAPTADDGWVRVWLRQDRRVLVVLTSRRTLLFARLLPMLCPRRLCVPMHALLSFVSLRVLT